MIVPFRAVPSKSLSAASRASSFEPLEPRVVLSAAAPLDAHPQAFADGGVEFKAVGDPSATITFPDTGTVFRQGFAIPFSGQAVDDEDGVLPNSAYTWRAALHEGGRTRGVIEPIQGVSAGSFVVPALGRLGADAFIRLGLTAVDSDGNRDRTFVDLLPFSDGTRPSATITVPENGETFGEGELITFQGLAIDPQDGFLPAGAFTWRAALHRDGRTRGIIDPIENVLRGSFRVPQLPTLAAGDFIRIGLTVEDSNGTRDRAFVDLSPRVSDQPPQPTISFPPDGTFFAEGDPIRFSGQATDAEDGTVAASNFTWRAALHQNGRTRGIIDPIRGVRNGEFNVPDLPRLGPGDFIRLGLRVEDSSGQNVRTFVDLRPRTTGDNAAPEPVVLLPADGTTYGGGDVIRFSGSATDPDEGGLPDNAFVWRAAIHEGDATRGIIDPIRGTRSGSFRIPGRISPDPDQFVRLGLRVTDSQGRSRRDFVDLQPRTSDFRVSTNFSDVDLVLKIDGKTRLAPQELETVEGASRRLNAPRRQEIDGVTYQFLRWSDGGDRIHSARAGVAGANLTAFYRIVDFDSVPNATTATATAGARFSSVLIAPPNVHSFFDDAGDGRILG